MRRFEFKDEKSSKFWQISQDASQLTVNWGRIGTKGQSKTYSFNSPQYAFKNQCKLIKEKIAKGYVDVDSDGLPILPQTQQMHAVYSHQFHEGKRVILRNVKGHIFVLTQLGPYIIVGEGADRLVQNLKTIKKAEKHYERIKMLREKDYYQVQQLDFVSSETIDPPTKLEMVGFDGKIDFNGGRLVITLGSDFDSKVPRIFCEAMIECIEQLAPCYVQLVCPRTSPKVRWQRALVNKSLASVESFVFDNYYESNQRQYKNSIGDVDIMLRACPNLKNFYATGALTLNPVEHQKLEVLYLLDQSLSISLLQSLGDCYFPSLKRMSLWLDNSDLRRDSAVISSLNSIDSPQLREIHIEEVSDVNSFLCNLGAQGMPSQWRDLTISGNMPYQTGNLSDVKMILENYRESFRSLEVLRLPELDEEGVIEVDSHRCWVKSIEESDNLYEPYSYNAW